MYDNQKGMGSFDDTYKWACNKTKPASGYVSMGQSVSLWL